MWVPTPSAPQTHSAQGAGSRDPGPRPRVGAALGRQAGSVPRCIPGASQAAATPRSLPKKPPCVLGSQQGLRPGKRAASAAKFLDHTPVSEPCLEGGLEPAGRPAGAANPPAARGTGSWARSAETRAPGTRWTPRTRHGPAAPPAAPAARTHPRPPRPKTPRRPRSPPQAFLPWPLEGSARHAAHGEPLLSFPSRGSRGNRAVTADAACGVPGTPRSRTNPGSPQREKQSPAA